MSAAITRPSVCFYFQVHQPFRLRRYSVFDTDRHYFDDYKNAEICRKVAHKCYLPANRLMLDLIRRHEGKSGSAAPSHSINRQRSGEVLKRGLRGRSASLPQRFEREAPETAAPNRRVFSPAASWTIAARR